MKSGIRVRSEREYHVGAGYDRENLTVGDKRHGGVGQKKKVLFTRFVNEDPAESLDEVIVTSITVTRDDKGKVIRQEDKEVARLDLDLGLLHGPCGYWSGRGPGGVPTELLSLIDEYLQWVKEEGDE